MDRVRQTNLRGRLTVNQSKILAEIDSLDAINDCEYDNHNPAPANPEMEEQTGRKFRGTVHDFG